MALQLWKRSKIISRKNVAYSLDSLHPMPGPWVDKSSSISRVTYPLVLFDWLVSAKGHLWFLCSETPLHIYVLQSPTECDKCFLMKKEEPKSFETFLSVNSKTVTYYKSWSYVAKTDCETKCTPTFHAKSNWQKE